MSRTFAMASSRRSVEVEPRLPAPPPWSQLKLEVLFEQVSSPFFLLLLPWGVVDSKRAFEAKKWKKKKKKNETLDCVRQIVLTWRNKKLGVQFFEPAE